MATLDELQTQIDAMKAFIGIDGYRAGQQRIRDNYLARLQDEVADAKLIMADRALDDEVRETVLTRKVEMAETLKRRIDALDKEIGPGEDRNRAARRRTSKRK